MLLTQQPFVDVCQGNGETELDWTGIEESTGLGTTGYAMRGRGGAGKARGTRRDKVNRLTR